MVRTSIVEDLTPVVTGRARDLPPEPVDGGLQFDALLFPHRSLPNAGFIAVMTIVIGVNLTLGTVFYAIGAWPVLGFCGLDVFLVWLAFKLSYRQGRLHERVRITQDELWVSRVLPSGHESRWRMQPYWTSVSCRRPIDEDSHVRLHSKGRTLVVGSFLSPEERGDFADALKSALARAQRTGA